MGPMNSARMHYSQLTKSTIAGWTKKKKKKREKRKGETQTLESLQSKRAQGHPADPVVPTNKNNTSQIKMLTSFKLSSSATIAKWR